jgi:putative tryptophan/tyrosine transport system substrate-binding protein
MFNRRGSQSTKALIPRFTAIIVTSLLLTACGSLGATRPKTYTIGVASNTASLNPVIEGFKAGLAEAGYIEGDTVTYIYDGVVNGPEAITSTLQGLKEKKVDLLLSIGTIVTLQAKETLTGTDIPVVFAPVTNPVKSGVVESLLKPGGNFTGVQSGGSTAKRLEWLVTLAPGIKRLYVPHNPDESSSVVALADLTQAAATLGVELDVHEARTLDEVNVLLATVPEKADGIFILNASTMTAHIDDFIKLAGEHKLPLAAPTLGDTKAGALISYGIDSFDMGKQAARLADQILKGTPPADLPVETSEFFLSVNLATADALNLSISNTVLGQVDNVIR